MRIFWAKTELKGAATIVKITAIDSKKRAIRTDRIFFIKNL